ncbi:MAG: DUF2892 domain-containing protein [Gammaproteobacteria bacterium]|nr:DUF2892 domain-containing protein [Gammaproteobacteria bacterium]
MIHNVGSIDKALRFIVGAALLSQVFWGMQTLWGLVGLVLMGTALMNFCPLYAALGMNTLKQKLTK